MNYHTRERFGPKQALTKEGYLLCEDVPIARIGEMKYGAGEIPLEPGPDGVIYVERFPEDVFRAETIASFNGKDVVDEHPDEDVRPDNWRWVTAGVVLNPHRGAGVLDDVLLADLMIKDSRVINLVRTGKREVSCGYDADYIQYTNSDGTPRLGHGKQINILGHHVALVGAGRCGPRCAIGDSFQKEKHNMNWLEKLKAAWAGKDEAAFNAALADAPRGETISLTTDQLKAVAKMTRDAMKEDEEDDDEKDKKKTKDAAIVDKVFADKRFVDLSSDVKRMADAFEKKDDDEDEEKKKKETEDNEKILGEMEQEAPPGTGDRAYFAGVKDSAPLVRPRRGFQSSGYTRLHGLDHQRARLQEVHM